ncbi:LysR family transcriptional regulator [Novosphingobium sp. Gsoil 351]|uniref:LysR family transcriptional regulator n=1 Tax=Novosphingobium sp. Gsoil 351 TaxID=2675225 RepID=UPI0012B4FBB7|nr:LysR family transcriptional regulator [Novosphingobium sp. Gsoil 351]QGN54564.1 LysR family transcriptional regulator [Novosphingobium sp. Gsoil 351]
MRGLTLRQLRAVLAISRLGKVSAAARDLGLTAPAVTLQIQQAEAAAGTPLFERASDGFRATDAGRATIAAARDIAQRLLLLGEEIAAIGGAEQGLLRLGAVSTAKYFVPGLIAGFAAEHPGIELQLTVANRAGIIAALDAREIDVALMGRPPRAADVATALIGDHPLVIIAAPDHPLAGQRAIPKRRIAQETILMREAGSGTRTSLELFLGEIPGGLDRPGPEFNSNETIKQAVMARMGVAMLSAHTIALELEVGRLAVLDVVGTPLMRQWFVVSLADRPSSPTLAAFREFVARRGRNFLPG